MPFCDNFRFFTRRRALSSRPHLSPAGRSGAATAPYQPFPGDGVTAAYLGRSLQPSAASFTGHGHRQRLPARPRRSPHPAGCVSRFDLCQGQWDVLLGGSGADHHSVVNGQEATATAAPVTLAGRTTPPAKLYGTLAPRRTWFLNIDLKSYKPCARCYFFFHSHFPFHSLALPRQRSAPSGRPASWQPPMAPLLRVTTRRPRSTIAFDVVAADGTDSHGQPLYRNRLRGAGRPPLPGYDPATATELPPMPRSAAHIASELAKPPPEPPSIAC